MARMHSSRTSLDGVEVVRTWPLSDGSRCVLALTSEGLELRLESGGDVVCRTYYSDIDYALRMAQRWRIEYDIAARSTEALLSNDRCFRCHEHPLTELDSHTGIEWLRCPSCGRAWMSAGTQCPTES